MSWKLFEESVFKYLTENICIEDVNFSYIGNSDSTKGDIAVIYRNNHLFNIECKKKKSQSSQFVLEIDREKKVFIFSKGNKSNPSKANEILNHMNKNFYYYATLNKSKKLDNKLLCAKELQFKFVIDNLISKGSRFIATEANYKGLNKENIVFFPTGELENFFEIYGKYRTKQSGTTEPSKKALISFPYKTIEIKKSKKKRFFVDDRGSKIPDRIGEGFFLAKVDPFTGLREVRFRSKTKNANVIFSLLLKKSFKNNSDDNYIRSLIFQEIQKFI